MDRILSRVAADRPPPGPLPRTFDRPAAEHDAFVGESLAGMARRFGIKF
jgi:hypothetical protein